MRSIESLPRGGDVVTRRLANDLPALVPNIRWKQATRGDSLDPRPRADLMVKAQVGDLTKTLLFEVKSIGEPRMAQQAVTELRLISRSRPDAYLVFAAPYISERAREICKAEGIGYVDLMGDVYLRFESVLIDKVSAAARPVEQKSLKTLFAPKATRVLRTLLRSPNTRTRIKDLAEACSMSPAGVYFVVSLLENKGFVTRADDRSITLTEPDRLLREWAKNWTWKKSRPNFYFSFDKTAEQIIQRVGETTRRLGLAYALTGMAGASRVAPFVRFADVSLYLKDGRDQLVKELDLRPVTSGANVVILDPYDEGVFAGTREIRGARVVSDIQLFVDLYTNPARGEEQAEALFERSIKFPKAA